MEHKFCDFSISASDVSRFIKSLDPAKATGLDKISVVLKNLDSEMSPILVKLFNIKLKMCFPNPC